MTDPTILRPIVLLSTTMSTNHAIRPLIVMFLPFIMALVASINLLTTAEAEPTVGFRVVTTAAAFGELGAGY
jgi:hypothetical protein